MHYSPHHTTTTTRQSGNRSYKHGMHRLKKQNYNDFKSHHPSFYPQAFNSTNVTMFLFSFATEMQYSYISTVECKKKKLLIQGNTYQAHATFTRSLLAYSY